MKKLITFSVIIFSSLLLFSACIGQKQTPEESFPDENTAMEDSNAEVLGDSSVAAPSIELAEGQELYMVDIKKSSVAWNAKKAVGTAHHGVIKLAAGNIIIADEWLVKADFVLDMLSLSDLDLEGKSKETLENHLKSDDFFAVEKYPVAELLITQAQALGDDQYELTGDLTIKDKTQTISFPATVSEESGVITASAEFSIDRTLWDIRFGSDKFFDNLADNVIEDEINFIINIIASR